MLRSQPLIPSLEAIRYQGKSLLYNELIIQCQNILDNPGNRVDAGLNISKSIRKLTGCSVAIDWFTDSYNPYGVWVGYPVVTPNTPLCNYMVQKHFAGYQYVMDEKLEKLFKNTMSWVDTAAGKVGGAFSKVEATLHVPTAIFTKGEFTAEELAAVMLHEIGHVFTYFEMLAHSIGVNFVIATASEAMRGEQDITRRVALVKRTAEILNVDLKEPESLAKPGNEGVFQMVVLEDTIAGPRSSTDAVHYDQRGSEFLADQFAIRQGAARGLALALDKLSRKGGSSSYRSSVAHSATEALKVAIIVLASYTVVLTPFVILGMVARLALVSDVHEHDDPGERIDRIRNDIIQNLKDRSLTKEEKDSLLSDLDLLAAMRKKVNDHRTLMSHLWIAITSFRRQQNKQQRFQQDLEKIVNNDLFAKATRLEQLA